jgi:hypothetical protein
MLAIFADESDDNHTYTLGGWAITPVHYGILSDRWRAMLQTIKLADGSPCPAFHASVMMRQDPPFEGWTVKDVDAAFEKATALIEQHRHFAMQPFGVAAEVPASFRHVQRDSVWLMLFVTMFRMLFETHPGAMSIEFVFDEKRSIAKHARQLHKTALGLLARQVPNKFLDGITMLPDTDAPPVQAADFLMYEWRKRISDAHLRPDRPDRPWFPRMRAARPDGALWRYGREVFEEALKADDQSATWARAVMYGQPSHRD